MAAVDDHEIIITGTQSGLGIRIVGGQRVGPSQESQGIFIKEVIAGSLAEIDGRLKRGDQLVKANGVSLVGVSNEKAVEILKNCAKTDKICFIISRSDQSRSEFRRLSSSPVKGALSDHPVATSTPRGEDQLNTSGEGTEKDINTRPSSASSDLTQISTTDISSHGDREGNEDERDIMTPSNVTDTSHQKYVSSTHSSSGSGAPFESRELTAKLSDLEVSLEGGINATHLRSSSESPPPLPLSPPPTLDDTEEVLITPKKRQPTPSERSMALAGAAVAEAALSRSRSPPEGMATSSPPPPQSAPPLPPSSPTRTIHTFAIPKTMGLGVIIAGGLNHEGGPHIFIDRILAGMDAAKDGQLKKGDRILTVNGESFVNITREKALTKLTQLKIKPGLKSYTVVVERSSEQELEKQGSSPLSSLPQPQRTMMASIFDSDTMVVSDHPRRATESPLVDTSPKVSDLKHTPQHKTAWLSEEGLGAGTKSVTPQRYLSKKDTDGRADSMHKRLSMDPSARVKLAKLEWALTYMGYLVTSQQKEQIHSSLDIDGEGRVVFLDFVQLAKEMFAFRLDDARLEASLVYALTQKDSLDMPTFPKKATSFDQLWREHSAYLSELKSTTSHPVLPRTPSSEMGSPRKEEELEHMRQQLHDLGEQRERERERQTAAADAERVKIEKENKKLRAQVKQIEKEKQVASADKERHKQVEKENKKLKAQLEMMKQQLRQKDEELRNTSTDSTKEVMIFRRRAELAEGAAKTSRDKANKLEDSVRLMEAELSVLKEGQSDMSNEELRRHLAAVDCQMRKEKKAVRRYEVATEKLLQFVENCHEALVKTPEADRILYHPHGKGESVQRGNAVTGNPRPPQYLSRHAKVTATTLAQEAQETITAVRKMLSVDTLPFGWEEAYTEDGKKYFINHESQTTSWVHPVTNINTAQKKGGGSQSSTPLSRSQTSSHTSLLGHSLPAQPRPNQQA